MNKKDPIKTIIFEDLKILIFAGWEELDPQNDNVDVEIIFNDGKRFMATFYTLTNLKYLFKHNKQSGECNNGEYFWGSDMIIVEKLTEEVIVRTVKHLISKGEVKEAFEGPYDMH